MIQNKNFQSLARSLVAAALALTVVLSVAHPVLADTAGQRSTRNILLGAAAVVGGLIIYNNIHHKQVAHNTVVGYTQDGGTVYADGRIVYPNGNVLYTANGNGQPCSWDGSQSYCPSNPTAYYPNNGYPNNAYPNNGYPSNAYPNNGYPAYNYSGYNNSNYNNSNYNNSNNDRDDRNSRGWQNNNGWQNANASYANANRHRVRNAWANNQAYQPTHDDR